MKSIWVYQWTLLVLASCFLYTHFCLIDVVEHQRWAEQPSTGSADKNSHAFILYSMKRRRRRVNRASHILQCGTLLQDMIFSYIYLPTMGQRTSYLIVCMQMSMFYLEGGHQSRLECQNNLTTTLGKNICRIQKNFTRPKNSIWSIEWIFCHAIF